MNDRERKARNREKTRRRRLARVRGPAPPARYSHHRAPTLTKRQRKALVPMLRGRPPSRRELAALYQCRDLDLVRIQSVGEGQKVWRITRRGMLSLGARP